MAFRGKHSEETKQRIRESARKAWTPEKREAARQRRIARNKDPEFREKIRQSWTDERRAAARQRAVAMQQAKRRSRWTLAEQAIARELDALGVAYQAQVALLGAYVVDFLIGKVALEIDGSIHQLPRVCERDRRKERDLRDAGYVVVRVTNAQAMASPSACVEAVLATGVAGEPMPALPTSVWRGRSHSAEARAKMSAAKRSFWASMSAEERAAYGKSLAAKRLTPETVEKLRRASKDWWANQPEEARKERMAKARANSPVFGKSFRHQPESIEKMREAARRRKLSARLD